jgi:hypothetical protein
MGYQIRVILIFRSKNRKKKKKYFKWNDKEAYKIVVYGLEQN